MMQSNLSYRFVNTNWIQLSNIVTLSKLLLIYNFNFKVMHIILLVKLVGPPWLNSWLPSSGLTMNEFPVYSGGPFCCITTSIIIIFETLLQKELPKLRQFQRHRIGSHFCILRNMEGTFCDKVIMPWPLSIVVLMQTSSFPVYHHQFISTVL